MASFPWSLFSHVQNVFEYNKMKYGAEDVSNYSMNGALHKFIFYFFISCIAVAIAAMLYYQHPLTFPHFSNMLLLSLKYNAFVLLYFITNSFQIFGISLLAMPFPTFMP